MKVVAVLIVSARWLRTITTGNLRLQYINKYMAVTSVSKPDIGCIRLVQIMQYLAKVQHYFFPVVPFDWHWKLKEWSTKSDPSPKKDFVGYCCFLLERCPSGAIYRKDQNKVTNSTLSQLCNFFCVLNLHSGSASEAPRGVSNFK